MRPSCSCDPDLSTSTTSCGPTRDVPLLDEALDLLGPQSRRATASEPEEMRTYGHIVVDEAQDLTPMAAADADPAFAQRLDDRRRRHRASDGRAALRTAGTTCSRTCPTRKPARVHELTIGYRIPAQSMALAARVLSVAAPEPSAAAIGARRRGRAADPSHCSGASSAARSPRRSSRCSPTSATGRSQSSRRARWPTRSPTRSRLAASRSGGPRAQALDAQVTVVPGRPREGPRARRASSWSSPRASSPRSSRACVRSTSRSRVRPSGS